MVNGAFASASEDPSFCDFNPDYWTCSPLPLDNTPESYFDDGTHAETTTYLQQAEVQVKLNPGAGEVLDWLRDILLVDGILPLLSGYRFAPD